MNIKLRLTVMNFFFNFCLGIWLISLGGTWETFGPIEGGSIGLSIGELTDLWAGRFYLCLLCLVLLLINILVLKSLGFAHIIGIAIYFATQATNSTEMYWVILQPVVFI
jgi:NHS family xanthosine MFS transporter